MDKEQIRALIVNRIANGRFAIPDNYQLMHISIIDTARAIQAKTGKTVGPLPDRQFTLAEAVEFFFEALSHQ